MNTLETLVIVTGVYFHDPYVFNHVSTSILKEVWANLTIIKSNTAI